MIIRIKPRSSVVPEQTAYDLAKAFKIMSTLMNEHNIESDAEGDGFIISCEYRKYAGQSIFIYRLPEESFVIGIGDSLEHTG